MIVLIFHGSRDEEHNRQARQLAETLGYSYAFMEREPYFNSGLGIPMFIADGADYRKALHVATVKSPPLIKWPGFVEYLKTLGAELYIFHGPDHGGEIGGLGLPVAFLEGEPNVSTAPCVKTAAPVVLTRGYIYKKIAAAYSRCGAELLPPLVEQRQFVEYLRQVIPHIVRRYAATQI